MEENNFEDIFTIAVEKKNKICAVSMYLCQRLLLSVSA